MAGQDVPAGHFTFTPATQQTTVVTTTTTTVSLPPFVFQPTDHHQKDPNYFPLAKTATPADIRDFNFNLGGQAATFREASSATSLRQYHKQQAALAEANGTLIRRIPTSAQASDSRPYERGLGTSVTSHRGIAVPSPPNPPSIAHAAELAVQSQGGIGRRSLRSQTHSPQQLGRLPGHGVTDTDAEAVNLPVTPKNESGPILGTSTNLKRTADSILQAELVEPRQKRRTGRKTTGDGNGESRASGSSARSSLSDSITGNLEADAASSAPGETEKPSAAIPRSIAEQRPLRSRTARPPPGLLAFPQQDASLPSPSLSPVTAAANLARSRLLAGQNNEQILDNDIPGPTGQSHIVDAGDNKQTTTLSTCGTSAATNVPTFPRSLMDIPEMVRMFDAMPEELQSYVGFQILKCCSKKTLKALSGAVSQALRFDPLDVLPAEVGLQITSLLDAKSLSAATQVSRRWRHLINSNEAAWKNLIDHEGFIVSDDELQQAIREGWGWQSTGRFGFEHDLLDPDEDASDEIESPTKSLQSLQSHASSSVEIDTLTSKSRSPRVGSKRKANANARDKKRHKHHRTGSPGDVDRNCKMFKRLDAWVPIRAHGPFEYAAAAARFMPKDVEGLPSLRDMHLYRSLYQRQQFIRQSWMNNDTQPKHLAFGAQTRHVVTCLLFDDNRIITGSDDNHIHIYDTQTGILLTRLEGHDGGVWALACHGDTLVSGSTDRTVRVWDIVSEQCKQTFQGHTSTVRCLVILTPTVIGHNEDGQAEIHPKEPIIITGSRDSTLRVWKLPANDSPRVMQPMDEADNPYALRLLQGHHNSVRAIAAHGNTLVSGSYDQTVRVWNIATGETRWRLQGHSEKVYSVVLDHERNHCISGSMDKLVKVWSLDTGECLFNLTGHTSLVGLLDLTRDFLVSAAADWTLRVWDPVNGRCISKLLAHTNAITCFQHDGQKVISGSDKTLKMWDIHTGECVRDLLTDLSGVWQVKFDQRRCVAAVQRENVTYIEVLDFGAARDGVPDVDLGRRIVVDEAGFEVSTSEARLANEPAATAEAPELTAAEAAAAIAEIAPLAAAANVPVADTQAQLTMATNYFVQQMQMAASTNGQPTNTTNTTADHDPNQA